MFIDPFARSSVHDSQPLFVCFLVRLLRIQVITATAHSSIGGGPVSMATADVAVVTPTTMRLSLDEAKLALGHELSVFPISATQVGKGLTLDCLLALHL